MKKILMLIILATMSFGAMGKKGCDREKQARESYHHEMAEMDETGEEDHDGGPQSFSDHPMGEDAHAEGDHDYDHDHEGDEGQGGSFD